MGNMLKLSAKQLAEAMGWTMNFANGYLDGNTFKSRAVCPSKELMDGTTEYAIGVQIGYNYGVDYLEWAEDVPLPVSNFRQAC
jgi:hypothetical protein